MKVRKHIYFSGNVQGVGFRYRAFYAANCLGLTGWVKNLYDGRVEMEVQGKEKDIDKMIIQIDNSSFLRIENMEVANLDLLKENSFQIIG